MNRYPSLHLQALRKARGLDEFAPVGTWRRHTEPRRMRRAVIYNATMGTDENGRITFATGCRWLEHATENRGAGLRLIEANATEAASRNHTRGYYCDLDCGDTTHGAVLALPGRDGCALLVPAAADPWNPDSYLCDFGQVFWAQTRAREHHRDNTWSQTLRDACRAADSLAEAYAESCREDAEREHVAWRCVEARETIAACRKKLRALARELRDSRPLGPAVCAAIREAIAATRAESHEAWRVLEIAERAPWELLPR